MPTRMIRPSSRCCIVASSPTNAPSPARWQSLVATAVRDARAVLGLPTGRTPVPLYAELGAAQPPPASTSRTSPRSIWTSSSGLPPTTREAIGVSWSSTCSRTCPRAGAHRFPRRHGGRPGGRVRALRSRDRRGRRYRPADSRHRRERPRGVQRARPRRWCAHAPRHAAAGNARANAGLFGGDVPGCRARRCRWGWRPFSSAADRPGSHRGGKAARRAMRRARDDAAARIVPAAPPATSSVMLDERRRLGTAREAARSGS